MVLQHMVPFFFMLMVYMGIFGFGQSMLTSLLEEKSSRVIEVLLACVSPLELMAGKIIGLAAMGLTVMIAWAACAGVAVQMRGLPVSVAPGMLAYMLVYYVLGFTLLSSLLAAIGSVCNTLKEAQGLMMPVTILFIIPMAGWFGLASHPNGLAARVMSFIPPLTPIVMILRLATPQAPGLLEVAGSIVWLAAATVGTVWLASKVFRTGVLMYGKRPGLVEILRWVRQS
jgi:ABC-2 type transport system permease protein